MRFISALIMFWAAFRDFRIPSNFTIDVAWKSKSSLFEISSVISGVIVSNIVSIVLLSIFSRIFSSKWRNVDAEKRHWRNERQSNPRKQKREKILKKSRKVQVQYSTGKKSLETSKIFWSMLKKRTIAKKKALRPNGAGATTSMLKKNDCKKGNDATKDS